MPLSSAELAAIMARVPNGSAVTDEDLDHLYGQPPTLDASQALAVTVTVFYPMYWRASITATPAKSIANVKRTLFRSDDLRGTAGTGCVVFRDAFAVAEPFRGRGLARNVTAREEACFSAWGVAEVQLDAVEDGRWVWYHLGYKFQRPGLVEEQFQSWLDARSGRVRPADGRYPKEFLTDDLYGPKLLPMYKSLP